MTELRQHPRRAKALRPVVRRVWPKALPDAQVDYSRTMWERGFDSAERFLERLPAPLDVSAKDVLDVGAGTGNLAIVLARRGARSVVGVDYDPLEVELGNDMRVQHAADVADRVELLVSPDLSVVGDRQFDVIVSKDSFEHYQEPEAMLASMHDRLRPGGVLAIGFGPLWNAPFGAHLELRVPYAHLVIPEELILERWNALRPGKSATRLEETGVNRMTLARFERMVRESPLEQVAYAENVSDNPAVRGMRAASKVKPLRELMVTNVYGVWRRPA